MTFLFWTYVFGETFVDSSQEAFLAALSQTAVTCIWLHVPLLCEVLCSNRSLPLSVRPFVLQPQSYEAVEPLDLEEFLMSQLKSGDVTLMQELGEFPDDDLKVEQIEKECRTVQHSVPNDA